jgi:hypothetical protein
MSDSPDNNPEKPKRGQPDGAPIGTDSGLHIHNGQVRMVGAFVLIGLGVIFLLQEFGLNIPFLNNWWALFILVPGLALLWRAYTGYQAAGRSTSEVNGQAFGGAVLVILASIFLFNLDIGKFWPLFLIVPGIFLLLNPRNEH